MTPTPAPRCSRARTARRAGTALAAAALLAGCGATSGGAASGTAQAPGGSMTATPATTLTVTSGDGAGGTTTWTLTCDPPGGDHPNPAGACAALEKSGATALPPVPKDRACTMIYGGPETATIRGTWRGERVDAAFNRTNGCEIARWRALSPLLPGVTGVGTS